MKNDKHTPGPWTWNVGKYGNMRIERPEGQYIAEVSLDNEKREADARLIAAAPELLAALETLIIAPTSQAAWNNARAAIARARRSAGSVASLRGDK